MKTFRVAIFLEEGQTVTVQAKSPEAAEEKVMQIANDFGGTDYPEELQQDCIHRDYCVQDVVEVSDENI